MRRFKLFTAALAAVIAVAVPASSGASAENLRYHVFDSFNGTSLNASLWYPLGIGPGTSQSVHDGSLWLTASSPAPNGFNTGITLNGCQVVGNFDAQMEFTLPTSTWPASDNVTLAIVGAPGNTFVNSQATGNVWGLFVPHGTGYGYIQFPASVHTGSLRLVRHGTEISSYFRTDHSRAWQAIGEFTGTDAPSFMGVAIWNTSGPFGGQTATAQVNSFDLEAAGLAGFNGFPCSLG